MKPFNNMRSFVFCTALLFTLHATGLPTSQESPKALEQDISVVLVDDLLTNYTPETFGDWHYRVALLLEGIYRVYKRTNDERYLQFIIDWADSKIDENGVYTKNIDRLDHMLPGMVFLRLYQETGLPKYRFAASSLCRVLENYPRTSDGGVWHMKKKVGQLWLDGVYMSMPLLVRYAQTVGVADEFYDEAVHQFQTYATHLRDPVTGLFFHAYDEDGSSSWAGGEGHHSAEFWGRSMGWFVMGLIEVLDELPADHSGRAPLIQMLSGLLKSIYQFQDTNTGLWYQVINKQGESGNWQETSCSTMYTYAMSRAVASGYVSDEYLQQIEAGYTGVMSKVTVSENGAVVLRDICEGTGVGNYQYYIDRKKIANDFHGLGAFLIMNEWVAHANTGQRLDPLASTLQKDIRVYPQPAHEVLSLDIPDHKTYFVSLKSMDGKEILKKHLTAKSSELSLAGIPEGIYLITVTHMGEELLSTRVIKN